MSLLSRIDTAALYQPFLRKLEVLLANCERRGAIYVATNGYRSWEEQAKIYAVGRTAGRPGHYLTKAPPGYSAHQYACAADLCRHAGSTYDGHLVPDWRDSQYEILAEEAEKLGLEPGLRWRFRDSPHIQLPLKSHGLPWSALRAAHARGGQEAVVRLLDQHGPW